MAQKKNYRSIPYGQSIEAGFTLIELMITSVIIALVITTVYFTSSAAIGNSRKAYRQLEMYQNGLVSLERISADLRGAFGRLTTGKDDFSFITSNAQLRPAGKDYGAIEVKYYLENGLNRSEIVPWPDADSEKETSTKLAPLVSGLKLKYYDGQQWLDTWDMTVFKKLPQAVAVTIKVKGPEEKSLSERTFSAVVPIFANETIWSEDVK
ncbi:MAG: type II secretion system protein GspJ [bacterium]|nr:type II secretion system protein GspJ [bacterium]MDD5354386.1 type II secretion system protein GspJ [bacterium]MDD5755861.1 type II secretion system protein GspJ [bacterium]